MMINIHGLVRGNQPEIGRDADTGGQTRYIIELVESLSQQAEVDYVDLATRKIVDRRVHSSYGVGREKLNEKSAVVRLPCGGKSYIRKEKLWPHLDEFTDRLIEYLQRLDRLPDFFHGHYADAGYVAAKLSGLFGIPLIFTGHSLGRNKLSFLRSTGMEDQQARNRFAIQTRIDAEEQILSQANLVVTSTNYERESLYGQYEHRDTPRYVTDPPGVSLEKFFPYYYYEIQGSEIDEQTKQAHHRTLMELRRFLFEPEKPLILALCRPDSRKNIDILIDVYGKDKELQAIANLAVFAGIREDISTMEEGERQVLTDILLAMDKYDLYGKMAIPKYHDPEKDVPEMYRIAALTGGVFVSTSYLETFGLTFIEASACGLPFIATDKGGPVDIQRNCESGILVDIEAPETVAQAMKKVLTDSSCWSELSEHGINNTRKTYSWEHHSRTYISELEKLQAERASDPFATGKEYASIGKRIHSLKELLIVDIDDTLLGDDEAASALMRFMGENETIGFGVATGRDISSAKEVLESHGIVNVDCIIASVGSEIYYFDEGLYDTGWSSHIQYKWKPEQIREALSCFPWLKLQENPAAQRPFKVSYDLDASMPGDEALPLMHTALMERKLSYNLIYSHGSYVDILPSRASKGKAIRYLAHKWQFPIGSIYTAGNSGNDRDMLIGGMKGIVVGNHEPELADLKQRRRVYFSSASFADGILEGVRYWKGLNTEA